MVMMSRSDIDALRRAVKPFGHQRAMFDALVADPGAFVETDTIAKAMNRAQDASYSVSTVTYALGSKLRRHGYEIVVHKHRGRAIVRVGAPPPSLLDDDGRAVDRSPHPRAYAAAAALRAAGDGVEFVRRA